MKKFWPRDLKTNLGADRHPHIVGRAAAKENDFVAGFGAKAEALDIELDAGSRVNRQVGIAVDDCTDLVVDGSCRHRAANAEVHNSDLAQQEQMHGALSLDLGSEQCVQQAHVGANRVGHAAYGDGLGLGALEVVSHFRLEHYRVDYPEAYAAAYAEQVQALILQAGVIEEGSDIAVVLLVLGAARSRKKNMGLAGLGQHQKTQRHPTQRREFSHRSR